MIKKAELKQAKEIANLHIENINHGFLPKRNPFFLQSLYRFFIAKELVLAYKEDDKGDMTILYQIGTFLN